MLRMFYSVTKLDNWNRVISRNYQTNKLSHTGYFESAKSVSRYVVNLTPGWTRARSVTPRATDGGTLWQCGTDKGR